MATKKTEIETSPKIDQVQSHYEDVMKATKDPNVREHANQDLAALVVVIGKKEAKTGGALHAQVKKVLRDLTEDQALKILGYLQMDPKETQDIPKAPTDTQDRVEADTHAIITDRPSSVPPPEFPEEDQLAAIKTEFSASMMQMERLADQVLTEKKDAILKAIMDARRMMENPSMDVLIQMPEKVVAIEAGIKEEFDKHGAVLVMQEETEVLLQEQNGLRATFFAPGSTKPRIVHFDLAKFATLAARVGTLRDVKEFLAQEAGLIEEQFSKIYSAYIQMMKDEQIQREVDIKVNTVRGISEKLQTHLLQELGKIKRGENRSRAIAEVNAIGREISAKLVNAKKQDRMKALDSIQAAAKKGESLTAIAQAWDIKMEGVEFFPLSADTYAPGPKGKVLVLHEKEEEVAKSKKKVEAPVPVTLLVPEVAPVASIGIASADDQVSLIREMIKQLPEEAAARIIKNLDEGIESIAKIEDLEERSMKAAALLHLVNGEVQEVVQAASSATQKAKVSLDVNHYIPAVLELSSWQQWMLLREIVRHLREIYLEAGLDNAELLSDMKMAKEAFQKGEDAEVWRVFGGKYMPNTPEMVEAVAKIAMPEAINLWIEKAKLNMEQVEEREVPATIDEVKEMEEMVQQAIDEAPAAVAAVEAELKKNEEKKPSVAQKVTKAVKDTAKKAVDTVSTFFGDLHAQAYAWDAGVAFDWAPKPQDAVLKDLLGNLFEATNGAVPVDLMSKTPKGKIPEDIKDIFGQVAKALRDRESSFIGQYVAEISGEELTLAQWETKLSKTKGEAKGKLSALVSAARASAKAAWDANQEQDKFVTILKTVDEFLATEDGPQKLLRLDALSNFFIGRQVEVGRHITPSIAEKVKKADERHIISAENKLDVKLSDSDAKKALALVRNVTDDKHFRSFMKAQSKLGLKLAVVKQKFPKETKSIKKYEDALNIFRAAAVVIDKARFGQDIFDAEGTLRDGALKDWRLNLSDGSILQRDLVMMVNATQNWIYTDDGKDHHLPLMSEQYKDTDGRLAAYAIWYAIHRKMEQVVTSYEWWEVQDSIRNVQQLEVKAKKPHSRGFWKATGWVIYVAGRTLFVGMYGLVSWIMRPVLALINAGKALGYYIASKFSKEKAAEYAAKAKESIGESWTNVKDIVMMPWRALMGLFSSIKAMWVARTSKSVMVTGKGVVELETEAKSSEKEATMGRKLSEYPFGDKTVTWKEQIIAQKAGTVVSWVPRAIGKAAKAEPGATIGAAVGVAAVATGVGMATVAGLIGGGAIVAGVVTVGVCALVGWGIGRLFRWMSKDKPAKVPAKTADTKPVIETNEAIPAAA